MDAEREIVELTKALIEIPSTHSRPDQILRCAEFITNWLTRHAIEHQQTVTNNIPSIIAGPHDGGSKVLLMTHFDVVEADDEQMFVPRESEGRLYGRGAIDDKYAAALSMVLFKDHLVRLRQSGGDQDQMCFSLLLTGDEEVGGHSGAAAVLDKLTTEYFIALDGGSPDRIITKEKGIIQIKLTAHGTAAHGARPWLGHNAFDVLVEDYQAIKRLFQETSPDHWHKTMVLSRCRAGDISINKVPDRATGTMDIRYTDTDDPDAIVDNIRKDVQSEVEVLAKEPLFIGGTSPYLDLLMAHTGATTDFEHGASDARFLSNRGIPGAVWGADGEMSQHTSNEHLVISSLATLYNGLDAFLSAVSNPVEHP